MKKGTFTMFNLRVGPGSTSGVGSFVGLNQAKRVAVFFQGSFATSAGTSPQVQLFPAVAPFAGSVDTNSFGTMVLPATVNVSTRRIKWFEGVVSFPYLTCKVVHNTGTAALQGLVKAIVQHD